MKKMILFSVFILIFLSGCKDYVEIENLTIATAIGVDVDVENPDWYLVSVEILKFDQDTEQVSVISGSGQTYLEAVTNATKQLGSQLYFAHAQVMVISEEVANDGIFTFVDAIYRNSDLRLDMAILIAKNTTAIEVLSAKSDTNDIAGVQLKNILDSNHIISEIPKIPVYEFINKITSDGVLGALSVVVLNDEIREIDGLAIFDNGVISEFLDKKQTKTLSFLQNNTKTGRVVNEYDVNSPTFNLEKSHASITPRIVDGRLIFDFKIDMQLELVELAISDNLLDSEALKQLESEITHAVFLDFNELILFQLNNPNLDFMGLGEVVYRKYPTQWGKINLYFENFIENLEYTLDVNCEIIGTGLVSSQLNIDV